MSTITLERLPNTVSACHAEIRRLQAQDPDKTADLKQKIASLERDNGRLLQKIEHLEDENNPDAVDAINHFLDQVERPVGKLTFDVLHGPATDRAILGLYSAAGRNL